MKCIGIIPARYASSRFPGKPLIDLGGKTMIQRVYEGASKAKMLEEVIVATDDQRIFDEVKGFGGKVVMTSEAHRTGTDRCGEVAQQFEADVVINIQGDEPLIDFRQLDQLLEAFNDDSVQIATLGIADVSQDDKMNPNRIKLVRNVRNDALYFSRSNIPNEHHSSAESRENYPFFRHIGVYAYRKNTLLELINLEPTDLEKVESLEQLRWMYYGYPIRVVETDIETPNIDVPEDVEKVQAFL
ncbi:MAG: 3-deoxy-manno-octulosonate cytidylyltransferase [Flavobacteriales bacterium]|nr:3-deoxy-manno-octulosonate cytidylyltransferase [Flavobacteriales bacterium]